VAGLFYKLGKLAGPRVRKGKWLWTSLTGTTKQALRAEYDVGRDMAAEVRRQLGTDDDAETAHLVRDIGRRLAACVTGQDRTFEVAVVRGEMPNAFALPGGFVFVTRPLVELCERREAELAFVVAHEMAHVIRGHALDRVLSDSATAAVSRAIAVRSGLGAWVRHVGVKYLTGAYSRDRELGADELGARLADAAGYGRDGAVSLLQRLDRLRAEGMAEALGLGQYFASHPPTDERIRQVKKAPPV
jgi:predicted Zn-dependent protease